MNTNIVNIFSNLNVTMCFTFIKDQTFMTPLITLSKSSFNDELVLKNQHS